MYHLYLNFRIAAGPSYDLKRRTLLAAVADMALGGIVATEPTSTLAFQCTVDVGTAVHSLWVASSFEDKDYLWALDVQNKLTAVKGEDHQADLMDLILGTTRCGKVPFAFAPLGLENALNSVDHRRTIAEILAGKEKPATLGNILAKRG